MTYVPEEARQSAFVLLDALSVFDGTEESSEVVARALGRLNQVGAVKRDA